MVINPVTGNGFKSCISYVLQEKKQELPENKRLELITTNNITGSVADMAIQMRFVAKENLHVKKPVLHLAISFHKDEKITNE